jgi:hypothetical protein
MFTELLDRSLPFGYLSTALPSVKRRSSRRRHSGSLAERVADVGDRSPQAVGGDSRPKAARVERLAAGHAGNLEGVSRELDERLDWVQVVADVELCPGLDYSVQVVASPDA